MAALADGHPPSCGAEPSEWWRSGDIVGCRDCDTQWRAYDDDANLVDDDLDGDCPECGSESEDHSDCGKTPGNLHCLKCGHSWRWATVLEEIEMGTTVGPRSPIQPPGPDDDGDDGDNYIGPDDGDDLGDDDDDVVETDVPLATCPECEASLFRLALSKGGPTLLCVSCGAMICPACSQVVGDAAPTADDDDDDDDDGDDSGDETGDAPPGGRLDS
jgi:Zn finger protein HypA/HybF involved in hydrogenase expression